MVSGWSELSSLRSGRVTGYSKHYSRKGVGIVSFRDRQFVWLARGLGEEVFEEGVEGTLEEAMQALDDFFELVEEY